MMQTLSIVAECMSAAVAQCSRDLRYLWVSKACADWLERAPEAIVGRPIAEVLGDVAFRELLPYFQRALAGEIIKYEKLVPYSGIGPRWIDATYTPTRSESG